jgi:transcriptional regulator with XRE-family HTH domain
MNSEVDQGLAERLRQCAKLAGSGDELARKTAIPRRTLEHYLAGEREPKVSKLVAIAEVAGVSVEWLASGKGPRHSSGAPLDRIGVNAKVLVLLNDSLDAVREVAEELGLRLTEDQVALLGVNLCAAELEEQQRGRPGLKPAQVIQLIKKYAA